MVDSTQLPVVDINKIATDLNGKMNKDGVNASCPTLLTRTSNSLGGATELWSDGYQVITGAIKTSAETAIITFDTSFANTDYTITATQVETGSTTANYFNTYYFYNMTTGNVTFHRGQSENPKVSYRIEGYIR